MAGDEHLAEGHPTRTRRPPAPLVGQVRIRVDATALGFVDGLIVQGGYQIKSPLPYVPGGEIAGVVDAVGAGVRRPSVGSRVVTWQLGGDLSEYLVVAANEVELIPAGLGFVSAAAMLVDLSDRSLCAVRTGAGQGR